MSILSALIIIIGLAFFETVSSVDNAIINGEVLVTMNEKSRKWFLSWGLIIAVFLMRGLIPLLIAWALNPSLGPWGVLTAVVNSDPRIASSLDRSAPFLLIGGGIFLIFLFLYWLFLEEKHFGVKGESFLYNQGVWFYGVCALTLASIVWFAIQKDPILAFAATIGSALFFITNGFKQNAERAEENLMKSDQNQSDISKLLYLEVIDATFSIDSVLGAFAFTLFVPLILLGNGIGALVVRQLTVGNISRIKKYKYLKNGAMYSIFFLGLVMLMDSFGAHIPEWVSPVITFGTVGYFFFKSQKVIQLDKSMSE